MASDRPATSSSSGGAATRTAQAYGVFGQRYDSIGARLGPEFRVNTYTTGYQSLPAVAADAAGNFVVVWQSYQDGRNGIFGQRYSDDRPGRTHALRGRVAEVSPAHRFDAEVLCRRLAQTAKTARPPEKAQGGSDEVSAQPRAAESRDPPPLAGVNEKGLTTAAGGPHCLRKSRKKVAMRTAGRILFVALVLVPCVASAQGGIPLGPEFRVNTYTVTLRAAPDVAADAVRQLRRRLAERLRTAAGYDVFGQRYAQHRRAPRSRVPRQHVHDEIPSALRPWPRTTSGNFVVVWESYLQDGSG